MSRKKVVTKTAAGNNNNTLVIVAVIGLIGTVITAYFGFRANIAPTEIIIDATKTAEAKLTEIAHVSNMTLSANSSSSTQGFSLVATETVMPAFTATAFDISSNILLQDEFVDNRNVWLLINKEGLKSSITDGKYNFTIDCPPTYNSFYCGNYLQVPNLSSKDLQFEIDATIKNVSPNTEVLVSFQFRRKASNYYSIYFSNTGRYAVNIIYNGALSKLLENTTIPSNSVNSSATNRYGFYAKDTLLKPLINGQELLSVEDGNFNQAGSVTIEIYVSKGGSATVELDNLIAMDKSSK